MKILPLIPVALGALLTFSSAAPLPAQEEQTTSSGEMAAADVQIMLDQVNFSPGSIDNLWGDGSSRTNRALAAFQQANGLEATGQINDKTLQALQGKSGNKPLTTTYQITEADAKGPFAESIPDDWKEKSQMERLPYTSLAELLGERFHVDPEYLKKLNPGVSFAAGETIKVPNVEPFSVPSDKDTSKIVSGKGGSRVIVSEPDKSLTVKDGSGQTLYYAPITPGSEKLPLPSGTFSVKAFDVSPVYYFSPDVIKEAETKENLKIPPGPNNPVGVVWIDLSKEHYGLHGTPEPEKIGYQTSHGCVRMTNWDALAVANLIEKGAEVEFVLGN